MSRSLDLSSFTIANALAQFKVQHVRKIVKYLALPKPWPTRKADMVEAISTELLGERILELWHKLDESQQLAVREALFGAERRFDL